MARISSFYIIGIIIILLSAFSAQTKAASTTSEKHSFEHVLKVSNMQVKISSDGHTATFQLYNTVAAKQFYEQLPLELELSNFRDAQWMFGCSIRQKN